MALTKKEESELLKLIDQEEVYYKFNKLKLIFGDNDYIAPNGDILYSRDKYPQALSFFKLGAKFSQRAMIAGNRTGKSFAGLSELAIHLTGEYPHWWEGKFFNKPITAYLCADRGDTLRDSLQETLLGNDKGEGLIPKDCIIKLHPAPGIPGLIGHYEVKHKKGVSHLKIKTYQSGRDAFEGFKADFIMLDEEVPRDIFSECITRTMTTNGSVICTFTPDKGFTDTYLHFTDPRNNGFCKYVTVTWDDVPHLSEEQKKVLLAAYTPQERECRSKGIPYLGKGKIYQTLEDSFIIKPIELPRHWPRVYGMDVGYSHPTAVVWGAWDRESDVLYLYSEYKASEALPSAHANAILARGRWIPGIIDSSSSATSATDGKRLIDVYERFGLNLKFVKKGQGSVEEGILEISDRLESGRIKVFDTLVGWLEEYRVYRRDDNGKVVKKNDDLMDAMRYLARSGLKISNIEPSELNSINKKHYEGRSLTTGY